MYLTFIQNKEQAVIETILSIYIHAFIYDRENRTDNPDIVVSDISNFSGSNECFAVEWIVVSSSITI